MKILILGTSNSIMRGGWLDGLKITIPEAEVENWSVGASPGIQFAAHMKRDLSVFDYIFLDSVPNDEFFGDLIFRGKKGFFSPEYFNSIMYDIASTICAKSNLIILGIPRREHYSNSSDVFISRKNLAFRLGAVFVDFRCAIGQYAQENNLIIDMCYEEHPAHPLRIISFGIGQSLGKMIKEGRFKKTIHNSHNNSYKFRIYTSENWPNFKKELRKNSLMR